MQIMDTKICVWGSILNQEISLSTLNIPKITTFADFLKNTSYKSKP